MKIWIFNAQEQKDGRDLRFMKAFLAGRKGLDDCYPPEDRSVESVQRSGWFGAWSVESGNRYGWFREGQPSPSEAGSPLPRRN